MKRMKRFIQRRPSAAMIVAVIALVAAIGGTAVAGSPFVTTTKFKKFKRNANSRISQSVRGPLNYVTANFTNPAGGSTDVSASCPQGTVPTGGGIKVENDATQRVNDSHPTLGGWAGTVISTAATSHAVQITAICATSASTGTRPAS